jgi:hypothetical protein
MRKLLLGSILALSGVVAAEAAERPTIAQSGRPLDDNATYYITYKCSTTDLGRYLWSQRGFGSYSAATHVFAITPEGNLSGSSFNATTANPIDPKIVFAVETNRGVMADSVSGCDGSLIAKGSDHPNLAYFLKFRRQTVPSAFATAFALAKDVIAPIYKVVRGHPIAEKDKENIEAINDVVKSYNEYLALFTAEESTVKSIPLKVGRTTLRTSVSKVTVDVQKIDSFLTSSVPFRSNYAKLVNFNHQFSATNLQSSCFTAKKALADQGFRSPDDAAFILYKEMDGEAFKGKKELIDCLGVNGLAPAVLKNRRLFPPYIPEDWLITEEDIKKHTEKPPEDLTPKILSQVNQLAYLLGRSGAQGQIIPADQGRLAQMTTSEIQINDNTAELVLTTPGTPIENINPTTSGTPAGQVQALLAAGFKKFGCFSATKPYPALRGELDGADVMMLAQQKVPGTAETRAVGLRLFFDGEKLKSIDLTNAWIEDLRGLSPRCTL